MTGYLEIIPHRLALAGGWIDQPFINRLNPSPPGSMVVVSLEPRFPVMERSGMATSTRKAALKLWPNGIPDADPTRLVRELYCEENSGRKDPSGSQDMIGLIYPGISRLDYDYGREGGLFPSNIETCLIPDVLDWLEASLYLIAVGPRPDGYSPLEVKNLDPDWIRKLGQSGRDCFASILAKDIQGLGDSFNSTMACWEHILPATVRHPSLNLDLPAILKRYQSHHPGAMFSGCGGGYLIVASDAALPGSFSVSVRRD